jgi:hypothetical protein
MPTVIPSLFHGSREMTGRGNFSSIRAHPLVRFYNSRHAQGPTRVSARSLPVFEISKGEPPARPYHRFVIASGFSARSKPEGGIETQHACVSTKKPDHEWLVS